jgi:hypothetical protein
VLREQHDRVADELGDRLCAGTAEQGGEARDLGVVEAGLHAVAAVDRDLGQPRDHVVGRVLALLDGQRVEAGAVLEPRLHALGGRIHLARFPMQAQVDPVAHRVALARRHTEHPEDDLRGEPGAEVGDRVELGGAVERIEDPADDLADHRLERRHRPRREHPADERAEPVVLRGVHHDDAAVAPDQLRILRERGQVDAVRARQALPVAVGGDDVGEAGERVEPVALAEVHGGFVPQSPVHVGGVVEVLVRERVELDGSGRHARAPCSDRRRGATGDVDRFRRAALAARVNPTSRRWWGGRTSCGGPAVRRTRTGRR